MISKLCYSLVFFFISCHRAFSWTSFYFWRVALFYPLFIPIVAFDQILDLFQFKPVMLRYFSIRLSFFLHLEYFRF